MRSKDGESGGSSEARRGGAMLRMFSHGLGSRLLRATRSSSRPARCRFLESRVPKHVESRVPKHVESRVPKHVKSRVPKHVGSGVPRHCRSAGRRPDGRARRQAPCDQQRSSQKTTRGVGHIVSGRTRRDARDRVLGESVSGGLHAELVRIRLSRSVLLRVSGSHSPTDSQSRSRTALNRGRDGRTGVPDGGPLWPVRPRERGLIVAGAVEKASIKWTI